MATNRARPLYKINRLASDELSYEFTCRGCTGTDILSETEYPLSFAVDKLAITEKIEKICNLFKEAQTVEDSLRRKIEAKLIHDLARLQNYQPKTVEERNVHRNLKLSLGSLKNDFNKLRRRYERFLRGTTVLGVGLLNLSVSSGSEDDLVSSTLVATSRSSFHVPNSIIRAVPVHEWKVKFSGNGKGLPLYSFIERIKNLRVARSLSEEDLFRSAYDLFEDPALQWYLGNCQKITDFQSLVSQLQLQFLPPDYNN
ncbi:hypothetical protein FQA39_LY14913 [Lamprigera yunnana]|nr:hypothetical protein FQA39_LY14913 [Lamprigera yunnana]